VLVFPGTWSERDFAHVAGEVLGWEASLLWHTEIDLGQPDAVVLPGGFAQATICGRARSRASRR
jgi:phosphoribosylformylglycinamidine synthase